MNHKVSIIVPVHNERERLPGCLASILTDLPGDAEVVVVDDASTDGSAEAASPFNVKVITLRRQRGPSAARNAGAAATSGELLAFVDADVTLRPGAIRALMDQMEAEPELLGCNGIFALNSPAPGLVSAFVNSSIHFQHLSHGARVSTAFTSLCMLRRSAYEQMGGWDERHESRYADDVNTRWHLPEGSIALAPLAQADHHKTVGLPGLLKHRLNIGHHFVRSLLTNASAARTRPNVVLIHHRYPLNTALAMGLLVTLPLPPLSGLLLLGLALNNAAFTTFTLRHRGLTEASLVLPLSSLEGISYGLGMLRGMLQEVRHGA